jgi:hypothetical protein
VHAGFGQDKEITGEPRLQAGERGTRLIDAWTEAFGRGASQWRGNKESCEPVEIDTTITANFRLLP